MFVAFLQGLNDLNILTMFYYYKELLLFTVIKLQIIQSLVMLPWLMKPLFGFLSDNYPLGGTRRKSYLMMVCLIEMSMYLYISTIPHSPPIVIAINMIVVMSIVFKNILAEGMVVELTQEVQRTGQAAKDFIQSKGNGNERERKKSGNCKASLNPHTTILDSTVETHHISSSFLIQRNPTVAKMPDPSSTHNIREN